MAVDFSESANKLINDVLEGHLDRNNLAVEIENGTEYRLQCNFYINHGDLSKISHSSTLQPVDPSAEHVQPTIWEIGLTAAGAGCNIAIVISRTDISSHYVIEAATPSNKTNYLKKYYTHSNLSTPEDYWDKSDDEDKHYSNTGWMVLEHDNIKVRSVISGDSPATCFIEISQDC